MHNFIGYPETKVVENQLGNDAISNSTNLVQSRKGFLDEKIICFLKITSISSKFIKNIIISEPIRKNFSFEF